MKRFDSKVSTFSIENGASNVIDQINGNIFNVVSNYIELKRTGTSYSACCPFHEEKTPSFNVSPAKGIYKCFGCENGKNGLYPPRGNGHIRSLFYGLAMKIQI